MPTRGRSRRRGRLGPFRECVRRVAPGAALTAHGRSHEDAGQTGELRFALNASINLVNQKLARRFRFEQCDSVSWIGGDHRVHLSERLPKAV